MTLGEASAFSPTLYILKGTKCSSPYTVMASGQSFFQEDGQRDGLHESMWGVSLEMKFYPQENQAEYQIPASELVGKGSLQIRVGLRKKV